MLGVVILFFVVPLSAYKNSLCFCFVLRFWSSNPLAPQYSDPLYSSMAWVYDMINVIPVWKQGYKGKGIHVRVNDEGIDASHPEFKGRFSVPLSCTDYLPQNDLMDHGTKVAAVIGADVNNNLCSVGIAPSVTLSSCNPYTSNNASYLFVKPETVDVSSNSYGINACNPIARRRRQRDRRLPQAMPVPCPFTYVDPLTNTTPCNVCNFTTPTVTMQLPQFCRVAIIDHCQQFYEYDPTGCLEFLDLLIQGGQCHYNTLTNAQRAGLATGITLGRGGKGTIFVWASGNDYANGENVNFEGFLNTRFTIPVGAVGKNGLHTSYSTPGAALFVVAPGGDVEDVSNFVGAELGGGCAEMGYGTSLSCPVVSGVVALMLEANQNLTWRDVQGILAKTSRMVHNDPFDDTLITNAASYQHSNFYGFGIVDALAAVEASKTWQLYSPEETLMADSGTVNLTISNDRTNSTLSTITLTTDAEDFIAENVVVHLRLHVFSRGDLDVRLTSPHGTESLLSPGGRPEDSQDTQPWELLTVRAWGESAVGNWTLNLTDIYQEEVDPLACVDYSWQYKGTTCQFLSDQYYCSGGKIIANLSTDELQSQVNGRTLAQACCACGGGLLRSQIKDRLIEWEITAYGRKINPPTMAPTVGTNRQGSNQSASNSFAPVTYRLAVIACLMNLIWI